MFDKMDNKLEDMRNLNEGLSSPFEQDNFDDLTEEEIADYEKLSKDGLVEESRLG